MRPSGAIDAETARAKVVAFLASLPESPSAGSRAIQDRLTHEYEAFWLFYWGVRSAMRPGEWAPVGGNSAIAVRKADGAMYWFGARDRIGQFAELMQTGELDRMDRRIG